MTDELRKKLRANALRAARTVTISLALGGCYGMHENPPSVDRPDAGEVADAGRDEADAAVWVADAGTDAGRDGGPLADAGPCRPDVDCNGPWDGTGDGNCDWDQFNACCDEHGWAVEPCFLPGGPLAPPEMPRTLV